MGKRFMAISVWLCIILDIDTWTFSKRSTSSVTPWECVLGHLARRSGMETSSRRHENINGIYWIYQARPLKIRVAESAFSHTE
ncbi:hypothetical protein EDD36DRAFT_229870 [Exophiala viscosa]|uniref:Secreted protein n=1 Tax=Exophiala viscosa TaxID=2486360 RepID=A0AAN6DYL9_9EURO|nr:hypothetical protein EDD36DRAFT_229870 [Exophiala viscosa]